MAGAVGGYKPKGSRLAVPAVCDRATAAWARATWDMTAGSRAAVGIGVAANRRRHHRAGVAGGKGEGKGCAGKQETKENRFRGIHGSVFCSPLRIPEHACGPLIDKSDVRHCVDQWRDGRGVAGPRRALPRDWRPATVLQSDEYSSPGAVLLRRPARRDQPGGAAHSLRHPAARRQQPDAAARGGPRDPAVRAQPVPADGGGQEALRVCPPVLREPRRGRGAVAQTGGAPAPHRNVRTGAARVPAAHHAAAAPEASAGPAQPAVRLHFPAGCVAAGPADRSRHHSAGETPAGAGALPAADARAPGAAGPPEIKIQIRGGALGAAAGSRSR